jgi:hypothetical protein
MPMKNQYLPARTDSIDANVTGFQINSPRTRKGSDGSLRCAVDAHGLKSFGCVD